MDDFLAEPRGPRRARCTVGLLIESLPPDHAGQLATALADDVKWRAPELARQLRERGYPLSSFTIRRHRRGECQCDV